MRKNGFSGPKRADEEVREAFHELNNNFSVISLWLTTLLEASCEDCRPLREDVAAAIRRNVAAAHLSTQKLRSLTAHR